MTKKKIAAIVAGVAIGVVGIGAVAIHSYEKNTEEYYNPSYKRELIKSLKTGEVSEIKSAKDYDELYDMLDEPQYNTGNGMAKGVVYDTGESTSEMAVGDSSASIENSGGYSDTNVREEGVGEADVVKTDGKRIYMAYRDAVRVVDISGSEMKELGSIKMPDSVSFSELYIKDNKLIVLYTQSSDYYYTSSSTLAAETYDVSDMANPKKLGEVKQSGNYRTIRVVDDVVYLFSNYYPGYGVEKGDAKTYIPFVQDELVTADSIFIPPFSRGSQFIVISSFSINDPGTKIDSKAVFGSAGQCYVSKNNIYLTDTIYAYETENGESETCLRKLHYENGELSAVGQVIIPGELNDSFSLDEYKGNLRLVSTISSYGKAENGGTVVNNENMLLILDDELNELSRIENLAKDESIYSARFMGDAGYFVTYKQMDPLFSVDLSDPKKPKILGELKIPGFSEYLHPYGEGYLLGIGMDADETGITTEGVKISLFDISDPSDVEEVQKYVIKDVYSTDVAYNYKSVFVDAEKELVGFSAYGEWNSYYLFGGNQEGFTEMLKKDIEGYSDIRGLYAGDRFYITGGNTIQAFDLSTFEKVDDIVL